MNWKRRHKQLLRENTFHDRRAAVRLAGHHLRCRLSRADLWDAAYDCWSTGARIPRSLRHLRNERCAGALTSMGFCVRARHRVTHCRCPQCGSEFR